MSDTTRCFGTLIEYLLASQHEGDGVHVLLANEESAGKAIKKFMQALRGEVPVWDEENECEVFLKAASVSVSEELDHTDEKTREEFVQMARLIKEGGCTQILQTKEFQKHLWRIFSHEASSLELSDFLGAADLETALKPAVEEIRKKRTVRISSVNKYPIVEPVREVLFTSNVLLTLPKEEDIAGLPLREESREKLRAICAHEPQRYWYDHPIPLGVSREADELIYGLRGLEDALAFEKQRGTVAEDARLRVVLSVSVTHSSLGAIAREYLQAQIAQEHFEGLTVYVFTEDDAADIATSLQDIVGQIRNIRDVFGVDGRYGRHYSFLKAVAALWQVCVDDCVRATFKIDLDQIFPQAALVQETGKSAFEHLQSALWGSDAVDADGAAVHLGMIAGALVNEADIHKGVFTPDVNFPPHGALAAEDAFFPRLPLMALSTRAEMMTRYGAQGNAGIDGQTRGLQRVHVTGGTNGILVDALRKYRPFTPSFIGRAEDQAYILCVHGEGEGARLRYVHAAGLLMRHDKAAFASEAIKAAKHGTFVGDLLRTLLFSHYAAALPGGIAYAKQHFAPFTSCFISTLPACFVMGRLVLSLGRLFLQSKKNDAALQLRLAARELKDELGASGARRVATQYEYERGAWGAFYDALDMVEREEEKYAQQRKDIKARVEACRVL